MTYIVSTDTVISKGYLRSVIYDLTREDYDYIPNNIADILLSKKNLDEIDQERFSWLLEKEYILEVPEAVVSNMTTMNMTWDYPAEMLTLTVCSEILETHEHFLAETIRDFQIPSVALIDVGNSTKISSFLKELETSSVFVIEWLTTYQNHVDYEKHTNDWDNLKSIVIYDAPDEKETYGKDGFGNIVYKSYPFPQRPRHKHHPAQFNVNTELITESIAFNAYFNRRLHIAENGTIQQSIVSNESFGNIKDVQSTAELRKIIQTERFKRYWNVTKDQIDLCKDCEHRLMCVDNREPKQRKNNEWYFDQECSYNPYLAQWKQEKHYQSPSKMGIQSDKSGFSIDQEKVQATIKKIWGIH